jgi:glutaconate CoA-transferase subunit A
MNDHRRSHVLDIDEAVGWVESGMTLGIGGFINSGHPMALVRALIRSGVDDLVVVGAASAGLEVDMLIAAGRVRKVITPYVGAEGLAPIGPAFRRAAQKGEIEVWELDEAHHYAGLRAAAQRLPFNPWRAGVGTSIPEINTDIKVFPDPIDGLPMLAIPAIQIDVCLLHAAVSDVFGNVQYHGNRYGDQALFAASDRTVVEVESMISTEEVRRNPHATVIPGADAVVRAPFGAHPFSADGFYRLDEAHIGEYVAAATSWLRTDDRSGIDAYLEQYIFAANDHVEYLEQVGLRQLLSLSEY